MIAAPRGFDYALEPARTRARWRRDTALARLATQQAAVRNAEADLAQLLARVRAQARDASLAWRDRADPRTLAHAVQCIASLQQLAVTMTTGIESLRVALAGAQQECARTQAAIEAFEHHRTDALRNFMNDELRKAAAGADDDWLARGQWQAERSGA